jgi:hypothetical protein
MANHNFIERTGNAIAYLHYYAEECDGRIPPVILLVPCVSWTAVVVKGSQLLELTTGEAVRQPQLPTGELYAVEVYDSHTHLRIEQGMTVQSWSSVYIALESQVEDPRWRVTTVLGGYPFAVPVINPDPTPAYRRYEQ